MDFSTPLVQSTLRLTSLAPVEMTFGRWNLHSRDDCATNDGYCTLFGNRITTRMISGVEARRTGGPQVPAPQVT
jgi:hypothetical protein